MAWLAMVAAAALQAVTADDVKAGVDAWRRGDHGTAVAAWRPLADRGDADAQFNLAQAYKLGRGVPADTARAIELYRRAAASRPRDANAHNLLGVIARQRGDSREALRHTERALALQPEAPVFLANHGGALAEAGRLREE